MYIAVYSSFWRVKLLSLTTMIDKKCLMILRMDLFYLIYLYILSIFEKCKNVKYHRHIYFISLHHFCNEGECESHILCRLLAKRSVPKGISLNKSTTPWYQPTIKPNNKHKQTHQRPPKHNSLKGCYFHASMPFM